MHKTTVKLSIKSKENKDKECKMLKKSNFKIITLLFKYLHITFRLPQNIQCLT